jgi:hypothetical protein
MNATVATKGRVSLADVDLINADLKREDLDREGRAALMARVDAAYKEGEAAYFRHDGSFSDVLHGAIKGLLRAEEVRMMERSAKVEAERMAQQAAENARLRKERMARWKGMSQLERALWLLSEESGNREWRRLAYLAADATTAERCPEIFESEKLRW